MGTQKGITPPNPENRKCWNCKWGFFNHDSRRRGLPEVSGWCAEKQKYVNKDNREDAQETKCWEWR